MARRGASFGIISRSGRRIIRGRAGIFGIGADAWGAGALRRAIAAGLLGLYLAFLVHITLFRFLQPRATPNLVPFRTMTHDIRNGGSEFVINFAGNLAAWVPLGMLPPLIWGRRASAWRVAAASFGFSLTIELAQGYSGRRVADVDDLILNTVGGLVGFGMWSAFEALRRRSIGSGRPDGSRGGP